VNAKVTFNESQTPSQQLVAQAVAEVSIIDSRGRAITLRKPGVLAQYRLVETLGESASNEVYVGMVLPLLYVGAIDGERVAPPAKKSQVEALIQQLDEHGVAAVMEGVRAHFGSPDPDATKAALGN
jgi:hypothetical protein